MTWFIAGMSRPREATSVAMRMRVREERKEVRLAVRWGWGREECRDVTGWERVRRVRWRRSVVVVRFVKIRIVAVERVGRERRVWRKAGFCGLGHWM